MLTYRPSTPIDHSHGQIPLHEGFAAGHVLVRTTWVMS